MSNVDCSLTKNYLIEKGRMTNECKKGCEECPLESGLNKTDVNCFEFETRYPLEAIQVVQKWSDEHPQMTMLDKFKEQHPNAPMDCDGTPLHTCPYHLGYEKREDKPCKSTNYICSDCWNRAYEGE